MAMRYAHDEAGVAGEPKSIDPIIYRHFKEEDGEEHLIAGYIIDVLGRTESMAPFRDPKWFYIRDAEVEVSKLRPFVYAQEMKRVLRTADALIRERFPPVLQCSVFLFRFENENVEVVLITSIGTGSWIFPKGNTDTALGTRQSAKRESFEEAGIEGDLSEENLGSYYYMKTAHYAR